MTGLTRAARGRRAFSLLEFILAIALLGLVASLFISGGSEMFRARQRTMADVFWSAVQAARLEAVQENAVVTMRFDQKARSIRWGVVGEPHELAWPGRNLEFLPTESRDLILLGGQIAATGGLSSVRFHSDGTTDRFRVQLTDPEGRMSVLELDPWTAAPVVRATP